MTTECRECNLRGGHAENCSHHSADEIQFRISVTGLDGCEIVLSHWPEGYALERHGEIVWREKIGDAPARREKYEVANIAIFLDALDEWGCDDNEERAKAIIEFQKGGYDLSAYREEHDRD